MKLKKCSFEVDECTYLVHNRHERSHMKKEVQSFLGMVEYYQQFIQNFTTNAEPLTDLTKKSHMRTSYMT